jgi:hypothetical protein
VTDGLERDNPTCSFLVKRGTSDARTDISVMVKVQFEADNTSRVPSTTLFTVESERPDPRPAI